MISKKGEKEFGERPSENDWLLRLGEPCPVPEIPQFLQFVPNRKNYLTASIWGSHKRVFDGTARVRSAGGAFFRVFFGRFKPLESMEGGPDREGEKAQK